MNFPTAFINAVLLTAFVGHCYASPLPAANDLAKPDQRATADEKVARQIAFFNSSDFYQAAQIGYEILRRDPKNSLARYYYAQTLYKLNRSDDAKSQFAECYKTTNDLKMKSNCYDALKTLAASSSSPTPAEAINRSPENGSGASQSSGNGFSSSSSQADAPTSDPALISRKLQIMTEGSANIEHKRQQMLIDVERAKERAVEYMNGIERFYRRPIMSNYQIIRWEQYENPQYPIELERSQRELKIKIEDLNAEFNRREAEILADCKARAAVYDQVSAGLKSQQKIGTSQIQLTPQHSNGFVRHYVNYDGNDPVSLKARQGELTNTKPVLNTKSDLNTRPENSKPATKSKAATRTSKP